MEGFSAIEEIETLLPLMAGVIVRIEKRDNTGTQDEVQGLSTVAQYIGQWIQQLSSDPQQKERVKAYSDDLGKLVNQVKGLAQRGAQKAQKQNGANGGMDPAAAAKNQSLLIGAKTKAAITAAKAKQQQAHKEKAFVGDQRRQDAKTFADIQRQGVETAVKARRMRSTEE